MGKMVAKKRDGFSRLRRCTENRPLVGFRHSNRHRGARDLRGGIGAELIERGGLSPDHAGERGAKPFLPITAV